MATFPTLTPSSRTYTPGEYPHSPFAGMNGKQNRTRHSNVMLSSQLRLGFIALTEAEMLSILSHYQGQQGSFTSFTLPSAVWSGVSSATDYQLTNYGWRYIEPPTVEDMMCGGHNVELVLETVPPEGTALAGLASIVTFTLTAGRAAAANGLQRTATISFSPGVVTTTADGLAATITLSLEAGTASGA